MEDGTLIVVALTMSATYFLPGIVASLRGTTNRMSVWVVNAFLGWTFVGWVVALAMAAAGVRPRGQFTQAQIDRREARQQRRGSWPPPR